MFQLLTKYLFQTKKLSVPGAGNFAIEAQSAVTDFASQTIEAPSWNILFNQEGEENNAENELLFEWLSAELNISKADAVLQYDLFCNELKAQLDNGKIVDWFGLGKIERRNEVNVFTLAPTAGMPFTGVAAKKVLREKASHNVLVGEKETTSEEMLLLLENERQPGYVGKFIAWTIFFILLGFIVWYLFFYA